MNGSPVTEWGLGDLLCLTLLEYAFRPHPLLCCGTLQQTLALHDSCWGLRVGGSQHLGSRLKLLRAGTEVMLTVAVTMSPILL